MILYCFLSCLILVKCARRRSSATAAADEKTPSNKGIEGMLVSTMLTPLVSKLMRRMNELYLPENMVVCLYHSNTIFCVV